MFNQFLSPLRLTISSWNEVKILRTDQYKGSAEGRVAPITPITTGRKYFICICIELANSSCIVFLWPSGVICFFVYDETIAA